MVPVTFTLGSSKQSIVTLGVGLVICSYRHTWSGVIGNLVMLVIVYTFDDIDLSVLRTIL